MLRRADSRPLEAPAGARFAPGERLVDSGEVLRRASASGCPASDCELAALAEALVTLDAQPLAAFPGRARTPKAFLAAR